MQNKESTGSEATIEAEASRQLKRMHKMWKETPRSVPCLLQ